MAFANIVKNDAQKEDMAVSLAVLLLKDSEKEITVSCASRVRLTPGRPPIASQGKEGQWACDSGPSGRMGAGQTARGLGRGLAGRRKPDNFDCCRNRKRGRSLNRRVFPSAPIASSR